MSSFKVTHTTWRQVAVRTGLIWVILLAFTSSPWGAATENYVARKYEFWVRHKLNKEPIISGRLKTFVYDDPTVAYYETANVTLDRWQKVLEALSSRQPKRIMIDKLFDLPDETPAQRSEFVRKIASLPTRIVVGAFATSTEIMHRSPLRLVDTAYNRSDLLPFTKNIGYAYGPHTDILPAFSSVGHLVYRGNGRIQPFFRINNGRILPHWSLYASDQLDVQDGQLKANNQAVPLDDQNRVFVNIGGAGHYYANVYSMKALIQRAEKGKPISVVEPGDTVLVLPAMYTGHTDWTQTALGIMPGGFVTMAMVNSVLTGQWLKPVGGESLWLAIGAGLGGVLGALTWGGVFWGALVTMLVLLPGIGVTLFVGADLVVPWLYPTLAMFLSAGTIFAERTKRARVESLLMTQELETASLVQKAFMPKYMSRSKDLNVIGYFRPASQCSGDWWGHFPVGEHLHYILVGDVMGHGVPAALVTAMTYATVRTVFDDVERGIVPAPTPKEMMERLNQVLFASLQGEVTMTMCIGLFDTDQRTLELCNAGHPFPVLFADDVQQRPRSISVRGDMLGIASKPNVGSQKLNLTDGQKVLIYTDGLLECRSVSGEYWTTKVLIRHAHQLLQSRPGDLANGLIDLTEARLRDAVQEDDYTVVVVEVDLAEQTDNLTIQRAGNERS